MLIKREVLDQIKSGDITLQFRRWSRATVKPGGTLRTAVGMLNIGEITELTEDEVTLADVNRAGFADLDAFFAWLKTMKPGYLCKIDVTYGGPDPRDALRDQTEFSEAEWAALTKRLSGMDGRAAAPWTCTYLGLIGENPGVLAETLAERVGEDKASFKAKVARLKELGLTIPMSTGYCLSARGKVVLGRLGR